MMHKSLFLLIFLICSCSPAKQHQNTAGPNVLFVVFDDLNDYIGAYGGHQQTITPNLDRLAHEGIRFTNAHSNAVWCAPSRVSMLYGYYPHTSGVFDGRSIHKDEKFVQAKDVVTHFYTSGYNTFGTGKIFHNGRGDAHNKWTSFGLDPDYGPFPYKDGKILVHPDMPATYTDKTDQGAFLSFGRLSQVPDQNGFQGWYADPTPWEPSDAKPFRYRSVGDRDKMCDELSADFAVDVINRNHEKPFFLAVGMVRPHTPYYLPDEYYERFDGMDIRFPEVLDNDLEDCVSDLTLLSREEEKRQLWNIIEGWPGNQGWKAFMQAYLASIHYADEQFGKILNALENSPYYNNTIIVVTSDHGYHTGEKNRWFKFSLWERSTKVPLIVKLPGNRNKTLSCDWPVSLLDIYPTLNELCNLPMFPNNKSAPSIEGISFADLLRNPLKENKKGPGFALTAKGTPDSINYAIKSKRYRYIYTKSGQEELYDHKTDPNEWYNIAKDENYLEVKREMHDWLLKKIIDLQK